MKRKTKTMRRFWFSVGIHLYALVAFADPTPKTPAAAPAIAATKCMENGRGFFRARVSGSIQSEISWANNDTECTGATRPDGGARMRFSHAFGKPGQKLVFLFGIPSLKEGKPGRNMPVNLTVIREGAGEFFGTTGEDKCVIDELKQEPIVGIPHRNRSYSVTARGFCIQPAPALNGNGSILLSRFDFSGRVDFPEEEPETRPAPAPPQAELRTPQ